MSEKNNSLICKDYNAIMDAYPILSIEEERKLLNIIWAKKKNKETKQAIDKLFKSNIRLVYNYAIKHSVIEAPIEDVINSGMIGLLHAINRFNPVKYKSKFATYAYSWVKLYCIKAINSYSSKLSVPEHLWTKAVKYRKLRNENINNNDMMTILKASKNTYAEIKEIADHDFFVTSMDAYTHHEGGSGKSDSSSEMIRLEDVLEDKSSPSPSGSIITSEYKRIVAMILKKLNPLQQDIIRLRHLVPIEDKVSLGVIGKKHGLCSERIRQIESETLIIIRKMITKKIRKEMIL